MSGPTTGVPEVCEIWCGRAEASDGCQCLGKLRRALAELDRLPPSGPDAARNAELSLRLHRILNGRFDPRTEWPGRRK